MVDEGEGEDHLGQGPHGRAAHRRHDGGYIRAPEREDGDAGEALLLLWFWKGWVRGGDTRTWEPPLRFASFCFDISMSLQPRESID